MLALREISQGSPAKPFSDYGRGPDFLSVGPKWGVCDDEAGKGETRPGSLGGVDTEVRAIVSPFQNRKRYVGRG